MAEVRIVWMSDNHRCEICGTSYAEGAQVFIDDQLILDLQPMADCCSPVDYQQDRVFEMILNHFGHTIKT